MRGEPSLSCPDQTGKLRPTFARGVSRETLVQARNGDVSAMMKLATFYSDGPQPVRDPISAFSWSMKSAGAGAPGGAFNVGLAYEDGLGIAADKVQAQWWYRKAAEQQYNAAKVNLAALLLNSPTGASAAEISEASKLVRKAADEGLPEAVFDMGVLSENGIGQTKDMNEALRWYHLGAEKKDTRAMLRLGMIYAEGIGGIEPDKATGANWLAQAVEPMLGVATAINGMLAIVYRFDDLKRRPELSRAATTDPALAAKLGLFLADKKNPARDPSEAFRLLRIAADAHNPLAALRIGVMYVEGDGTSKDDSEGIKWLREDVRLRTIGSFQRVTKFTDKPIP